MALPKTVQLGQVALDLPGQIFDLGCTLGLEAIFQRLAASLDFPFEVAVRARSIHPGLRDHPARLFPRESESVCVRVLGLDKPSETTAGFLIPHFAPAFPCARCFTKQRFSDKAKTQYLLYLTMCKE